MNSRIRVNTGWTVISSQNIAPQAGRNREHKYEDSKIHLEEWSNCGSCEEMNKTEENVCYRSSDLTIPSIEIFNSKSHFNP